MWLSTNVRNAALFGSENISWPSRFNDHIAASSASVLSSNFRVLALASSKSDRIADRDSASPPNSWDSREVDVEAFENEWAPIGKIGDV